MKMKLPVGMIGLALIAVFGYDKVHHWQQQELRALQAKMTQERATQQLQGEVANLLQQVETYRKELPQEPDPSWLAREAVAISKETGVQLTTISQDTPQATPQFTRLAVTLQFTASYHQLGAFLDRLEHSTRFIHTDRINITSPQGGGSSSIQLVLSTVYVPPVAGSAGG